MKLKTKDEIAQLPSSDGCYQTMESVVLTEPRLSMIERRLTELLKIVQLESKGQPIEADGFRLRDPAHWSAPAPPAFSDMWHISSACNMRCPFCYEEGDPDSGSVLNEPAGMASLREIETRIKYRDQARGTGLFQPLTYINEIFCNPDAIEIMERLRGQAPDEVFTFVTNGTYLTEEVVERIAAMKPVFFNFSVNSLDPHIRTRVLRDLDPEVAIRSIELLRKYEVPYLGSLVCWPTIPWSDIESTVRKLDAAGCAIIRFSLSAYSKHLKGRRFDRQTFWDTGVALARRLASELDTPIKIEPYHYADPSNAANIVGTLVGSASHQAGLRPGDRILSVNDRFVPSVNHALSALSLAANSGQDVRLDVARADATVCTVTLGTGRACLFPASEMQDFPGFPYGLILVENLQYKHLKLVADAIRARGARRVLLLSSELMRPIVEKMIEETQPFGDTQVMIEVPSNRHFGGTVVLGDLLVVDDYVAFIREHQARLDASIDLVVIPSSPFSRSGWMRDLTGKPASDIERLTGIPVEFVECRPLNG
jgi:hypothetical protein